MESQYFHMASGTHKSISFDDGIIPIYSILFFTRLGHKVNVWCYWLISIEFLFFVRSFIFQFGHLQVE